jgi:hypothetical protein
MSVPPGVLLQGDTIVRRLFLLSATALALLIAGALSQVPPPATGELKVEVEERNPWTSLRLNNDPVEFRFAIVSDRTGGHRPRIFSQAVEQLNLLQPEFVVCVGDLIEGYTDKMDRLTAEWKEFQTYVSRLQMPFFYVAGNHDLTNAVMDKLWQEKFGRRWYHFVYRNVLFLMLNSNDPVGKTGIGEEQRAYIRTALEQNPQVRWTLVYIHHPLWTEADGSKNGWSEVEHLLAGRKYTVFAGHVHRYQKFVRQGMNYYQLATTGGVSRVRGISYGEFDHLVWVTMKQDGPVLANLMLDGIYPEDMRKPVTEEPGMPGRFQLATHPAGGRLTVDGVPAPGAVVVLQRYDADTKRTIRADALVEADGSFALSTYGAFDGVPLGEYTVTVTWRRPLFDAEGKPGPNLLPPQYGNPTSSGLTAKVVDGVNQFTFDLKSASPKEEPKKDKQEHK